VASAAPARLASVAIEPAAAPAVEGTYAPSASPRELLPLAGAQATVIADPMTGQPLQQANVNLAGAFDRASFENPQIALAQERVEQAVAEQRKASMLMLPDLNAGASLHIHRGNLQQSFGNILNVSSQGLFVGAGAKTLAAETVGIPGVRLFVHLGDAIMAPQIAGEATEARIADSVAVRNETLYQVAESYLQLVGADARVAELMRGEATLAELARLTKVHAEAGQGRQADANRAAVNLDLLRRRRQEAEGERAATSARLAGLMNLDPSEPLAPLIGPLEPLALVNEDTDLDVLVAQAFDLRPERQAGFAELNQARLRYRQERMRPLLPTISAGFSGGTFGGGSTLIAYSFANFGSRTDFDAAAFWTWQNFGFGNVALQRQTDAQVGQSAAQLGAVENRIAREVGEAQADAKGAKGRLLAAQNSLVPAEEGTREELTRIQSDVANSRPLEAIGLVEQVIDARLNVVQATTDYNIAQFRLWVALGRTPFSDGTEHMPEPPPALQPPQPPAEQ
jgi:outer membrane protein TolC